MKRFITLVLLLFTLTGCSVEGLSGILSSISGELVGNEYTVYSYDNFGSKVLTVKGSKIALRGDIDAEGNLASDYVDITIDGEEWNHVGGTLVFVQEGADMITDFSIPEDMESDSGSTGWMDFDRVINEYKNFFGRESVVVVSSQTGTPICIFQGDDVYTRVPSSLPKTTMISIDGKLVYVHRANIDIIPAKLFNE